MFAVFLWMKQAIRYFSYSLQGGCPLRAALCKALRRTTLWALEQICRSEADVLLQQSHKPRGQQNNKPQMFRCFSTWTKETDAGMSDLQRRFDKFKKKETWQDMFETYTNLYLSTSRATAFNRMVFIGWSHPIFFSFTALRAQTRDDVFSLTRRTISCASLSPWKSKTLWSEESEGSETEIQGRPRDTLNSWTSHGIFKCGKDSSFTVDQAAF